MKTFYLTITDRTNRPHIIGLTASPVMGSHYDAKQLEELQKTFDAYLYTPVDHLRVLRRFAPMPVEVILRYPDFISMLHFCFLSIAHLHIQTNSSSLPGRSSGSIQRMLIHL